MSDERENGNARDPASLLGSPAFSEMLGKVLSNPEILGAVAGAVSGGASIKHKEEPTPAPASEPSQFKLPEGIGEKLPELMSVMGPIMSGKTPSGRTDDKRSCLLRAIKPYVNPSRQEAIEYMIKFSVLADVLKNNGEGGSYV